MCNFCVILKVALESAAFSYCFALSCKRSRFSDAIVGETDSCKYFAHFGKSPLAGPLREKSLDFPMVSLFFRIAL